MKSPLDLVAVLVLVLVGVGVVLRFLVDSREHGGSAGLQPSDWR